MLLYKKLLLMTFSTTLVDSISNKKQGTKITIPEILLNTKATPSIMLPMQGMMYPQKCFGPSIPSRMFWHVVW
jgi:hypothetical protein